MRSPKQEVETYDLTGFVDPDRFGPALRARRVDGAENPLLQLKPVSQSTVIVVISDDVAVRGDAKRLCDRKSPGEINGGEIPLAQQETVSVPGGISIYPNNVPTSIHALKKRGAGAGKVKDSEVALIEQVTMPNLVAVQKGTTDDAAVVD